MSNSSKMYADDTKVLGRIRKIHVVEDTLMMQDDINKVVAWTNTWLMRLNVSKCKVMHLGKRNSQHNYLMSSNYGGKLSILIEKTKEEKDLGVLISNNLKFTGQANKAASEANKKLGILKKTFRFRGTGLWKKLYTTYVRPHLEFAILVWNPYHKGDIKILERVQHKATISIL